MFLQEIDGLKNSTGVFVIGATNRPTDIDVALLRGGRLSLQIEIPLPDQEKRKSLFELHSRKLNLADVDFNALAEVTEGKSGADIKDICQSAALKAFKRDSENIVLTAADLESAVKEQKETSKIYKVPKWMKAQGDKPAIGF